MPDIYALADRLKAEAARKEREAAKQLVLAYGEVYTHIRANLEELFLIIKDFRAEHPDESIPPAWLLRQERFRTLMVQAKNELDRFSAFASGHVATQQFLAGQQGQQDALALMRAGFPPHATVAFNALPTDALQNIVGFLQDGSPLKDLFDEIPGEVTSQIKKTLLQGVALGLNGRTIARQVRRVAGVGLTRSLTIARTETLRAYRHATIHSYRENADVVEQWEWLASRSVRTCAMCLAMDGKRFPLTTPFGSHPNCRCTAVPVLKSWEELGFEGIEEEVKPETGAEWFAKQPEAKQEEILGPGKFAAWKAGQITLQDLVGYRKDRRWGPERWEKPLKDVLAA